MKRRPLILIALIVLLPLAALTWAGLRIAKNETIVVQERFRDLMEDRLQDVNANVVSYFGEVERSLNSAFPSTSFNVDQLREINRTEPRILQLFVLNAKGQLEYPNPAEELNGNERLFLLQAAKMFTGQDLKDAVLRSEQKGRSAANVPSTEDLSSQNSETDSANSASRRQTVPTPLRQIEDSRQATQQTEWQALIQQTYQQAPVQNLKSFDASSGWFVWYWDRGLNLIYWQRRPSGHIVGCALERARWMADLIAKLPETVESSSDNMRNLETRVRLVDSSAMAIYQWGNFEPSESARPLCEVPVAVPLSSWRLQCFVPIEQLTAGTGRTVYASFFAGLAAIAGALAVIAFIFVREYARDMQEAAQQVSFVNQVSHELKTPLTNIRMYAELLDRDLESVTAENVEKPRQRLEVILSEGQRLSRLIGNVLTFARQKRKTLQVQPQSMVPDRVIHKIVDRFRPALVDQQIDVQLNGRADQPMTADPDFLEQILGNLINNVEKYAGSGGMLSITSSVEADLLTVDVSDAGPGIEKSKRNTVFEPFSRVSSHVSYAAGTGIGLSIARELARLHGGDLILMETETGCQFRATMKGQRT